MRATKGRFSTLKILAYDQAKTLAPTSYDLAPNTRPTKTVHMRKKKSAHFINNNKTLGYTTHQHQERTPHPR